MKNVRASVFIFCLTTSLSLSISCSTARILLLPFFLVNFSQTVQQNGLSTHENRLRTKGIPFGALNIFVCLPFISSSFFSIFVERRGLLICEKEIFCIPADIYFHSYESHAELRIEMRQRRVKEREREKKDSSSTQSGRVAWQDEKKRNYFRNAPCA